MDIQVGLTFVHFRGVCRDGVLGSHSLDGGLRSGMHLSYPEQNGRVQVWLT